MSDSVFKQLLCKEGAGKPLHKSAKANYYCKHQQRGFTLLEIMVVISLIALVSSAVLLTLPNKNEIGKTNPNQAAQFSAVLRTLSLKAMLSQNWYGLHFSSGNYQPVVYQEQKWQLVESINAPKKQPENSLTLLVDNQVVDIQSSQYQSNQENNTILPQIIIAPNGLFNNFELRLIDGSQEIILKDPYASL